MKSYKHPHKDQILNRQAPNCHHIDYISSGLGFPKDKPDTMPRWQYLASIAAQTGYFVLSLINIGSQSDKVKLFFREEFPHPVLEWFGRAAFVSCGLAPPANPRREINASSHRRRPKAQPTAIIVAPLVCSLTCYLTCVYVNVLVIVLSLWVGACPHPKQAAASPRSSTIRSQ